VLEHGSALTSAKRPPGDSHVHSEWSWDAVAGSMIGSCARAVRRGVRSIAFTEHADFTVWTVDAGQRAHLSPHYRRHLRPDGLFAPPDLDLAGYLNCVQRCRERFPELRVLTGVELSEPHWHPERTAALLGAARIDRALGSVHSLRAGDTCRMVDLAFADRPALDVLRDYLTEVLRLVGSPAPFHILAHLDYPVRYWPATAAPFRPADVADELRSVLRALAASGRALEINTQVPLAPELIGWWAECGGERVSFGSDAHRPADVAHGFAAAADAAAAAGFRPGRDPVDLWWRARARSLQ
jgi:histidinol-phosphatase (PHP family)